MALVEMLMPQMGESVMEGTVLNWLKNVGDRIEEDEAVLEVATDKVDTEIPSTHAGVLKEILAQAGDVIEVGKPVAIISIEDEASAPEPMPEAENTPLVAPVFAPELADIPVYADLLASTPFTGRFYSPLVMNIAREEGISQDEMDRLPGTGKEGRLTKADILDYVKKREGGNTHDSVIDHGHDWHVEHEGHFEFHGDHDHVFEEKEDHDDLHEQMHHHDEHDHEPEAMDHWGNQHPEAEHAMHHHDEEVEADGSNMDHIGDHHPKVSEAMTFSQAVPPPIKPEAESKAVQAVNAPVPVAKPAVSFSGEHEIVEMDRMRKMIAQRMVDSKRIAPHVTSFVEADVTNIVFWRRKVVDDFKKREGVNITYTTVFMHSVARALRDYPMLNASVDGDNIIVKKDINLGMAVALPTGNLIVPVIKNADRLSLSGMAHAVTDMAKRARENKLKPDDLSGGTYTVSNIGSFGNLMGTPIIMQPQVGILSLGAVIKKPAVIETPTGDVIGIRHMMFLSHSYDHRVVDGALGGKFVRRVGDYLEQFDMDQKV